MFDRIDPSHSNRGVDVSISFDIGSKSWIREQIVRISNSNVPQLTGCGELRYVRIKDAHSFVAADLVAHAGLFHSLRVSQGHRVVGLGLVARKGKLTLEFAVIVEAGTWITLDGGN